MEKRIVVILLFWGVRACCPTPVYSAATTSNIEISQQIEEKAGGYSRRKVKKIQRLQTRMIEKWNSHSTHRPADYWLWMGLFCLGLGFCLAIISITLGGIVAAAGVGCLFIWGFFKLGAL